MKSNLEKIKKNQNSDSVKKEFSGKRSYSLPEEVEADCNHGLVIDQLVKVLKEFGISCKNSKYLDLYIKKNKKIITLFELKTKLSRQVVYTAIGQLLLNSGGIKPAPKLYFVCPQDIQSDLVKDLITLKINVLTFKWNKSIPVFNNIHQIT